MLDAVRFPPDLHAWKVLSAVAHGAVHVAVSGPPAVAAFRFEVQRLWAFGASAFAARSASPPAAVDERRHEERCEPGYRVEDDSGYDVVEKVSAGDDPAVLQKDA